MEPAMSRRTADFFEAIEHLPDERRQSSVNTADRCPLCQSESFSVIQSYKHRWLSCNECGNIFRRRRKPPYFVERWIPRRLLKPLLRKGVNYLYSESAVIREEERSYDLYGEVSPDDLKGSKWEGQLAALRERLQPFGIDLKDKVILDISGGPGLFVKELRGIARYAVTTEFSQTAVD